MHLEVVCTLPVDSQWQHNLCHLEQLSCCQNTQMNKEKKKEVVDNSYRCYSWWAQKLASTSLGEPVAVSGDATGDTHSATVEHSHHGRGTTLPIRRCLESGQACTAGQSTLSSPCAPRSLPICHLDQTHFLQCAQHQPTCGHDFHHVCWSHHRGRVRLK